MSVQNKHTNLIRRLVVLGLLVAALGLFGFSAPNVERTDRYPKGFQSITRSQLTDTDFTRVDALTLTAAENDLRSAVIDTAGGYAYFGTFTSPGVVVKVRLSDFTRVAALTLNSGESYLRSAVIDPADGYAYFGTGTEPGIVVQIDLGHILVYLPVVFR
jgi:hypothetical protein